MEKIMKYINRVYRASLVDREAAFSDMGLQGHQISYIRMICACEGLTQDELSRHLFLHKSSVARQLKTLEDRGFVIRQVDEEDKRIRRIYPTQKSKALYPKILEYLDDWDKKITHFIKEDERDYVINLLKNLAIGATKGTDNERLIAYVKEGY